MYEMYVNPDAQSDEQSPLLQGCVSTFKADMPPAKQSSGSGLSMNVFYPGLFAPCYLNAPSISSGPSLGLNLFGCGKLWRSKGNPEAMPQSPEAIPPNTEALPQNPEAMLLNPEAMPQNPEAMHQKHGFA